MSDADLLAFAELRDGFLAQAEEAPRPGALERALIANDAVEQALTSPYHAHTLNVEQVAAALAHCEEVRARVRVLRELLNSQLNGKVAA